MSSLLKEADNLVSVDRRKDYVHPKDDFTTIGKIWGAILNRDPISPETVALMMIGLKVGREAGKHKRDNLLDIAGYAKCHDMIIGPGLKC